MKTTGKIHVKVMAAPTFTEQPSPVPVDFTSGKAGEHNVYYAVQGPPGTTVELQTQKPLPPGVTAQVYTSHTDFAYDGRAGPGQVVDATLVAKPPGRR